MGTSSRRIYYGWWVVVGAFLLLFCAAGTHFYAFPVFLDVMVREMGWARTQAALAMTIGTLVTGAMGVLVGVLIRRIGFKLVMVPGTIMAGLGLTLLRTVSEPWQFYLCYGVILSVGVAGIGTVASMTAVETWFDNGKSTALGIASTGIGAGGIVMPLIAGWLVSNYDWQTACTFMAGILMLICLPISAVVVWERGERPVGSGEESKKRSRPIDVAMGKALKQKAFWLLSLGAMLWYLAYTIGLAHQVAFAVDAGISRVAAAGAVSLLCVFSIPARILFGRLGDIMDKRYVMIMAGALEALAFVVLLKGANLTTLYIYSALMGIGVGALAPILPGLIADYFGRRHFGGIYGILEMLTMVGDMIGPVYAGRIFDITKSYQLAFLSGIAIALLVIVLVCLAPKANTR